MNPVAWRIARSALAAFAVAAVAPAAMAEDGTPPDHPQLPPGHPPIGGDRSGYELPGQIRLHGRFDVAYERYGYSDDPGDGKDAFRNYHRFLFLERHTKDDPFYFNAEVLGFNFYELGVRFHGERDDIWHASLTTGKVLVPFGADPLYHHAYGGRIGADQRVVPVVWSEFGLKGAIDLDLDPVALRFDAYVLRGYALRKPTDVLNLQTMSAPVDDLNYAAGGRISAAFQAATLTYSFYGGTLDHDRSLFMHALDASLWRLDVPVLDRFAFTLGVMRADVWGGGVPAYYNFADYLQVRFYATDCLYIQYRGGLDTRDNRSGLFTDAARLDQLDTSGHSVAVGWNQGNFTLVVQHHWQLELVDEIDDDFLRVTATYEF